MTPSIKKTAIVQAICAVGMADGTTDMPAGPRPVPGAPRHLRVRCVCAVLARAWAVCIVARVTGPGGRFFGNVRPQCAMDNVVPDVGAQGRYLRCAEHVVEHGKYPSGYRIVGCEVRIRAHVEPRAVYLVSQRDYPR